MTAENIILFDGVCNLCNGLVSFIIRKDTHYKFKFTSIQSGIGNSILTKHGVKSTSINTVILISDNKVYTASTAAILILKELGGFYKVFYVFIYLPKFTRDFFYFLVAKNRYRMFGKRKKCRIPEQHERIRFLAF